MIPADVLNIIVDYAWDYTDFKDFVDIKKINWRNLSSNPNAIHLLEKNLDKVYWDILSENPNIFKDNKKELKLLLLKTI